MTSALEVVVALAVVLIISGSLLVWARELRRAWLEGQRRDAELDRAWRRGGR
jgi:hypothetical protein